MGSGGSRAHEAFTLATPGQLGAGRPNIVAVDTDTDTDGDTGAGAGDTPPVWTDDELEAHGTAGEVAQVRSSRRTYRGDLVSLEMENVTAIRDRLRRDDGTGFVEDITVALPDGLLVDIPVRFASNDFFYGLRRSTIEEHQHPDRIRSSTCSCGRDRCGHRAMALDAVRALVHAERIRSGVYEWETTSRRVREVFGQAYQESVRARAEAGRPDPDGPAWTDDRTAFQQAYRAARDAHAAGHSAVPYMTDNATDGLGARDGGRGFGVEIEFDVPGQPGSAEHRQVLAAIGRDLHAAGITPTPSQTGYHHGRADFSRWRFERDCTVAGEIVSPILYDEPETWDKLQTVCDIVTRHGGTTSMRTGGHVHVGVGDYDHTPENHQQLLQAFGAHQDTLYRLAHNPNQRTHRGTRWCAPNMVPSEPYQSSDAYQSRQGNHSTALNFQSVAGRQTDHVEFRMWDGSLDPATIQTRIKLSLAMADAAFRSSGQPAAARQPLGSHHATNRARLDAGERLRGEAWRADTANFRGLMDRLFRRTADREQATALFAATRWQRNR